MEIYILTHKLIFLLGEPKTNSGPDRNKPCHFPFEYLGKEYHSCTEVDSPGRPWCSTKGQYSNKTYGYCDCHFGMFKWFNLCNKTASSCVLS